MLHAIDDGHELRDGRDAHVGHGTDGEERLHHIDLEVVELVGTVLEVLPAGDGLRHHAGGVGTVQPTEDDAVSERGLELRHVRHDRECGEPDLGTVPPVRPHGRGVEREPELIRVLGDVLGVVVRHTVFLRFGVLYDWERCFTIVARCPTIPGTFPVVGCVAPVAFAHVAACGTLDVARYVCMVRCHTRTHIRYVGVTYDVRMSRNKHNTLSHVVKSYAYVAHVAR